MSSLLPYFYLQKKIVFLSPFFHTIKRTNLHKYSVPRKRSSRDYFKCDCVQMHQQTMPHFVNFV